MTMCAPRRRVALVTGSSRGIGRATLLALASDHDVAVHYRRQADQAKETAVLARALGARVIVIKAELEDEVELRQLVGTAVAEFGRIDTFVASAASGAFLPITHSKHHHVTRTFATIVTGFTDLVRAILPDMPDGGRIVVVSGGDSRFAVADHGLIGAAKAALESLVRNLAVELGPRGITVNSVVPGSVETDSMKYAIDHAPEGYAEAILRSIPLGRHGRPEDVAAMIAFLCSASAAYVTGASLTIDGGVSAGGGPWVALQSDSLTSKLAKVDPGGV